MSNELKMPELNMEIIRKYICPTATEQEIYTFLQLCALQKLNPFLREVYLVKYGTSPATIVTGKETFTKRADSLPNYDGFKAGIIVLSGEKIIYREGSFYTSAEQVLGGWAEVYVKGRAVPYRNEVSVEEYAGKRQDGTPTKMWSEKKATMIRKIALVQSLREAFPNTYGGQYSPEEISTIGELPVYEIGKPPLIPAPSLVKTPRSKSSAATAEPETTQPAGYYCPVTRSKAAMIAPETTQPEGDIMIGVSEITFKIGKQKDGTEYTKYTIQDTTGNTWTTFDKKVAEEAKKAKESGEGVIIKTEVKGQYVNIVEMKPMPEEPLDPELSKLAEEAAEGLNL